jgi:hypothetical protein
VQLRTDILKTKPFCFRVSLRCHDNERMRWAPSPFDDHSRNSELQNTVQENIILGTVTGFPTTVKEIDYRIVFFMGVIAPWQIDNEAVLGARKVFPSDQRELAACVRR